MEGSLYRRMLDNLGGRTTSLYGAASRIFYTLPRYNFYLWLIICSHEADSINFSLSPIERTSERFVRETRLIFQ